MSKREAFLLRLDPKMLALLKQWSADELRSVNGQIEFVLRQALVAAGRWPKSGSGTPKNPKPNLSDE